MAGYYMSVRLYFHKPQASENTAQEHMYMHVLTHCCVLPTYSDVLCSGSTE